MSFQPGDRVIYTKRGEARCYDTEWPGVFLYQTPTFRCAIRLDGRKRISIVREWSLHPEPVDDGHCRSCHPDGDCTAGPNCVAMSNPRTPQPGTEKHKEI